MRGGVKGKDVGRGFEFGDCDEPDWQVASCGGGGNAREDCVDVGGEVGGASGVDTH